MQTTNTVAEQTITCRECGFKWQRRGGRGNQELQIDSVAYRTKCKHANEVAGFGCPEMQAANSRANQLAR